MIKRENYLVIQGFMVTDLHLKGNELLIYAIIYGFSQSEEQAFNGSLKYLADWTNSSKQGVLKNLKSLIQKGYIIKQEQLINGANKIYYHSTEFNGGIKQSLTGYSTEFNGGIKQSLPNNIYNNIYNNINNNKKEIYKEKADKSAPPPPRHKYGLYKNVLLSNEDMEKLKNEFPNDWQNRIERLSEYMASSGKKYKSHLATIRTWARKDKKNVAENKYNASAKDEALADAFIAEVQRG